MFKKQTPKTACEWYNSLDRSLEVFSDEFVMQGHIVRRPSSYSDTLVLNSKNRVLEKKRVRSESVVAGVENGIRYLIKDGSFAHKIVCEFMRHLDESISTNKSLLGGYRRLSVIKRYAKQLIGRCATLCACGRCETSFHEKSSAEVYKKGFRSDIYVCENSAALACVLIDVHTSMELKEDAQRALDARRYNDIDEKMDWWKARATCCEGVLNA